MIKSDNPSGVIVLRDRIIRVSYAFLYLSMIFIALVIFANSGIVGFVKGIDWTTFSIKRAIYSITDFCVAFGLVWVAVPFCMSNMFDILYDLAQDELLEGIRLSVLSPYQMSKDEIIRSIRRGESVYVEDIEDGICCLITQGDTNKIGVVKRLQDDSIDQFDCEDVAEEIIAMSHEGVSVYSPKALKELSDRGFELQS